MNSPPDRPALVSPGLEARQVDAAVRTYAAGDKAAALTALRSLAQTADEVSTLTRVAGYLASEGEFDLARTSYLRALERAPQQGDCLLGLARCALELGGYTESLRASSEALALEPRQALGWHLQGLALEGTQRLAEAVEAFSQGLPHAPDASSRALLHRARARVWFALKREDHVEAELRAALALGSQPPEVYLGLHKLLRCRGQLPQVIELLLEAVQACPEEPLLALELALAYRDDGQLEQALQVLDQASRLAPFSPQPHLLSAEIYLHLLHQDNLALLKLQQALACDEACALVWGRLHQLFSRQNRREEAWTCLQRAVDLSPDDPTFVSTMVFVVDHDDACSREQRFEARRTYQQRIGVRYLPWPSFEGHDPNPDKVLRVGYVSADFREHSVARCLLAVFEAHDPNQVEILAYSGVRHPDAMTQHFEALSAQFKPVFDLGDEELAELIRKDRIDILVDCSGHSEGNRLPVFARKPAPVQISAWGYANGTGLLAMDYLLASRVLIPPEHEAWYAETILPVSSSITTPPPAQFLPQVESPALARGSVTFGCFNRFDKVSPSCLGVWAALLRALPGARLLLKDAAYDHPSVVEQVTACFVEHGVEAERIAFAGYTPRDKHLLAYNEVDLALDPFPSGGGATTLDALWMGVPCITCTGDSPNGRVTASLMVAAGLDEFVVSKLEDYVLKAHEMAGRLGYLQGLRASLRERLLETSLFNPQHYTREVESAYRTAWTTWCRARLAAGEPSS